MLKRSLAPLLCLCLTSPWLLVSVIHPTSSARAVMPGPQAVTLIINEYLADPPDGIAGDANGDGTRDSTQDEFVEIVNTGAAPLNIGNFTISDSDQVRFTIPAGKIIPAGESAVIFGGGVPMGDFGNADENGLVFAVGGSGLSLNNGGDSIIVRDNLGMEVARRDYPSADGNANQSLTRSPDVTGTNFVIHSTAPGSGGRLFSPGARVNGRPFVSNDPAINAIAPDAVVAGSGAILLTVTGSNFQDGSQVRIDGNPINTMFVGMTQLNADIPASITGAPGVYAVTVRNPDATVSNSVAFTVLAAIGVNEYLADPPDGDAGDANGDGTRSASDDEFIEIINRTASPLSVGGFTVGDATQVRFTFPPNTIIPAGEAAVIFGGGTPTGEFGNATLNGLVFTASLSLNNGGDTITLQNSGGAIVETITFGASEGNANQSINRNPDVTGAGFAPHSTIPDSGGRLFSPGTRTNGEPFTTGPRIAQLTPTSALLGSSPFDLSVQGSGFEPGAIVFIDSAPVATTFRAANELTARVPATVTAVGGNHPVEVRNQGGNRSNIAGLEIIVPPPVLHGVSPGFVEVGRGSFQLFARGVNFTSSSVALIDGTAVATSFLGVSELSATVPATFTATVGTHRVRIRNGDGLESNEVSFEVVPPGPRLTSVSPAQVIAGGPEFTLTADGAHFRNGSVVLFDQTRLETRLVSAARLQADVPAALIRDVGLHAITVQDNEGASSNEAVLRVLPLLPLLISIEPASVIESSGEVMLTITGEKFQPGATAFVAENASSGPPLDTQFITGERLEARLPAVFTRAAGRVFIAVRNPDSGYTNPVVINVLIKDPLVINEFLADPPNGLAGDANGDGSRSSSQDEFVEIVNRTAQPLDISGYKLADADAARHVFAPGTILPPFEAAVVFGGGAPAGQFGNAAENKLVFKASSGGLSLNNGGDTIRLEDASGRVVQEIAFGAEQGDAGQSVNRDPDADGATFSPHTRTAADPNRLFSPGTKATGQPFSVKPRITALAPASVRAQSPAFTLRVAGANFLPGATVLFNDSPLETIYRSETELEARATAELVAEGGAAQVRVRNPKGEVSAGVKFLITDDPPRLAAISPQKTGTGAENFAVTITGERFQRGATARIAGQEIEARFINPSSLAVVIPAHFFTSAGLLEVRVLNADNNLSNAVTLMVENGPLITRLSKSRFKVGRDAIEVKVGGVAFQSGVVLFVNDTAVITSFINDTSFTARIPAEMTAGPGTLTLQARHPDGGRSNRVTIRVVQ